MAKVHVCNVLVLDNPAQFMSKLEFEITFECIEDLPEDLEWKIIYGNIRSRIYLIYRIEYQITIYYLDIA